MNNQGGPDWTSWSVLKLELGFLYKREANSICGQQLQPMPTSVHPVCDLHSWQPGDNSFGPYLWVPACLWCDLSILSNLRISNLFSQTPQSYHQFHVINLIRVNLYIVYTSMYMCMYMHVCVCAYVCTHTHPTGSASQAEPWLIYREAETKNFKLKNLTFEIYKIKFSINLNFQMNLLTSQHL